MPTANEIRQQFIDFFVKKHGHTAVPSGSVVPLDDPTLMFTNAGMNQFKDVFLGTGTRPFKRAVDTQKCIRVSGKHNDLEEVGRDTYHHTFFEMLGNWSFGDYYKAEAIEWAWELLTRDWGIDKTRLHATVFGGDKEFGLDADEEAFKLWTKVTDINPQHVHRCGKKDNFWMMGETGPCGPCSEIHIDKTPDKSGLKLVNAGDARVMEIWNLVFIQYNRDDTGKLTPLPAKHVDTGMGFERLCAILQKKDSNYDTDVFSPIMDAIGKTTGKKYGAKLEDQTDIAFRVIADHLRMLTFSITDGALPGNKGRGSVLRSVLRRAVRFGWQCFEQREPFIYQLVPALVEHMGAAFPELRKNPAKVAEVIKIEEADFLRTIERGLEHLEIAVRNAFQSALEGNSSDDYKTLACGYSHKEGKLQFYYTFDRLDGRKLTVQSPFDPLVLKREFAAAFKRPLVIDGQAVFDLHTTHGFPPDLTKQIAQERGVAIDEKGYDRLMAEHGESSRRGTSFAASSLGFFVKGATNDSFKWETESLDDQIAGWVEPGVQEPRVDASVPKDREVGLILNRTCFYAEAGGQVGDRGLIKITDGGVFSVLNTLKVGDNPVHWGRVTEGQVEPGKAAHLEVSPDRAFTKKNHTATHLLHWALHKVLGEHVEQRGSKVKPDEFTFDFSHSSPLTEGEKAAIEQLVNEKIYQNLPVNTRVLRQEDARKLPGVKAFFGDKYGDEVRVVEIGNPADIFSREFCGGTHLAQTGQAGFFKVVGEEAVGKGVRRLTCVTARDAVMTIQKLGHVLSQIVGRLHCKPEELPARIALMQDEIKKLQQQLKKGAATDLAGAADKLAEAATDIAGVKVIVGEMPAGPEEQMRQQIDRLRQKVGSAVIVFAWTEDSKVGLLAAVTDDVVKKGGHAGKLIGQVAKIVGGGGGGKPTMAQAGGKDPSKIAEALEVARKAAAEQLTKSG